MSTIDLHSPHTSDGDQTPAPLQDQRRSNAGLLIEAIGTDRLDIRAVGSFNMDCLDTIAARLEKLVASACHLYINFHTVVDIDDTVATLFRDAAVRVEAAGGTLDLVGLHASFFDDSIPTSNRVSPQPGPTVRHPVTEGSGVIRDADRQGARLLGPTGDFEPPGRRK